MPADIRQQLQHSTGLLIAYINGREGLSPDLLIGDILLSIDGVALDTTATLRAALANKGAGDKPAFSLVRAGNIITVPAALLTEGLAS